MFFFLILFFYLYSYAYLFYFSPPFFLFCSIYILFHVLFLILFFSCPFFLNLFPSLFFVIFFFLILFFYLHSFSCSFFLFLFSLCSFSYSISISILFHVLFYFTLLFSFNCLLWLEFFSCSYNESIFFTYSLLSFYFCLYFQYFKNFILSSWFIFILTYFFIQGFHLTFPLLQGKQMSVKQYQYIAWPAGSPVPTNVVSFLHMIEEISQYQLQQQQQPQKTPMVVHCL